MVRSDLSDSKGWIWHLMNRLRGSLGVESSVRLILVLLYLKGCEPATWAMILDGSSKPGGLRLPSSRLVRIDALVELDHLPDDAGISLAVVIEMIEAAPMADLPALFEECLSHHADAVGRTGQAATAFTWLNQLVAAVVAPIDGSIHDPACGYGGTLLAAARAGAERLSGTDVNGETLDVARMRLALHGVEADLTHADSLRMGPVSRVERVMADPPLGMTLDPVQSERWGVRRRDDLGAWLRLTLESLNDAGIGVVLCSRGSLGRSEVFLDLVATGVVEAVVMLPSGTLSMSGLPVALVVLRREKPFSEFVLALNLESYFDVGERGRLSFSKARRDDVSLILREWRERRQVVAPGHVGVVIDRDQIVDEGFRPKFAPPPEEVPNWPAPAAHLLQHLRIDGVKLLSTLQRVPLAPITLVYGPNSAGKTTVLKSLLMLLQSVQSSTLVTKGRLADLGSFASLVSGHNTDRRILLGIDFGIIPPWPSTEGALHPHLVREVSIGFRAQGRADAMPVTARIGAHGMKPLVAVAENGVWQIDANSLDGWTDLLDDVDQAFLDPGKRRLKAGRKYRRLPAGLRRIKANRLEITAPLGRLLPTNVVMPDSGYQTVDPVLMLGQRLNRALGYLQDELQRLADRTVYLGPVRPAPQRVTERGSDQLGSTDFASYLFDNSSALDGVNKWLARLGIGYTMAVLPVSIGGSGHVAGDLVAVVLTDLRTGVKVSPADVGYGVSQVLPIVVECLRATESLICVEQPELHLHPRLQANLADLMIEVTSDSGGANQVIAETHSEHLLLRLQRRIREGTVGPEQVAVLYVDHAEEGEARTRRLRLGDRGEFLDPWPTGFFDDTLDDVLGGWT